MKFSVITLFPNLIESFVKSGLLGQAVTRGEVTVDTLNPRTFTTDVHQTVDDRVFGGGDGMAMKVEPLLAAVKSLAPARVVLLTPHGRRWSQRLAKEYALLNEPVAIVCGRYAGVDQRFSAFVDDEISLGDFILNGGEVAACALIESVVRLKPGVLGNSASAQNDSFSSDEGLLEAPQFTRPREVEGMKVPSPLLSGDHKKMRAFERATAVFKTHLLRPDLIKNSAEVADAYRQLEVLDDSELKALNITRDQLKGRNS